ncbi:MAG: SDR family oxidoreductase [Proteobacteria bacterium]|nr:SDR family oxidoreductase [Pseudomonadota bacterium]MBU1389814.1 SDR family oxidoreductase [Pseudomonadota bacterium]MBU1543823.1 SDR family oxidoreductase [Pseudomonadota bacterium]MBU2430407.1 SDR family oxidoreductase [Pseudomonadota bacterium]MBU2483035.1 SDR family oxidoreductase [Pseudomonadota bacterium]
MKFDPDLWAVIIGGSSGFGLASAKKLARHGMNLCIVHRDRRGAMSRIQPQFDQLQDTGVKVVTFNLDALSDTGRTQVLDELETTLAETGKIRMLLHAVAFGNLKLLVPETKDDAPKKARNALANALGISQEQIHDSVKNAFEQGQDSFFTLMDPPAYSNDLMLEKEDFTRTVHAMGSNILEWVQDIFRRNLFAKDARILSLTSEGNTVAWKGYAAVAAAKAVLESVSRAMAKEFAPYGIRSNVIQAGVCDTPALRVIPGNQRIKALSGLRNPFGRLTQPEDVADVVFLLCLDEAAWINGALICADGGEKIG